MRRTLGDAATRVLLHVRVLLRVRERRDRLEVQPAVMRSTRRDRLEVQSVAVEVVELFAVSAAAPCTCARTRRDCLEVPAGSED